MATVNKRQKVSIGSTVGRSDVLAVASWGAIASLAVILAVAAWKLTGPGRHTVRLADNPAGIDPTITGSISKTTRREVDITTRTGELAPSPDVMVQLADLRREVIGLKRALAALTERHDGVLRRLKEVEKADKTGKDATDGGDKRSAREEPAGRKVATLREKGTDEAGSDLLMVDPKKARAAARTRFGLDLGDYSGMDALKKAWLESRREHSKLVGSLSALAKSTRISGKTRTKLIAGPFDNAADAISVCAQLRIAGAACRPTHFEGRILSGE